MKTIFKQILLASTALLFLSQAYSLEPGSTMSDSMTGDSMTATTSSEPVSKNNNAVAQKEMMPETYMPKGDMPKEDMPKEDMTGFSRGTVARSIFTTLIDNREPVDKIKQVPQQKNDVFYFTELRDMQGQTAKHRWEYKGKVIAEVKFNVRGPRWRVWSKKSFVPGWAGDWKVSVVNGADEVISEEVIAFTEASHDIVESEELNKNTMDEGSTTNPVKAKAPVVTIVN